MSNNWSQDSRSSRFRLFPFYPCPPAKQMILNKHNLLKNNLTNLPPKNRDFKFGM